ncbi:MAG: ATP-binding cassette domain-containing protein [Paracoccaceae bacterium]
MTPAQTAARLDGADDDATRSPGQVPGQGPDQGPAAQLAATSPKIATVTPIGPRPTFRMTAPAAAEAAPSEAERTEAEAAQARAAARAERTRARAELACVFARLHGSEIASSDVAEALGTGADLSAQAIATALGGVGLVARTADGADLAAMDLPAMVWMTSGQVVLVLGREGGGADQTVEVYDTTCPGNRAEVPLAEFAPYATGTVLHAAPAAAEVARRHGADARAPHWFWGEMLAFRRNIAEIALGSLVANALAVAVALFSLQVYDRVIPHQSTATLTVLALGALIAILLEASLRIARAAVMDGAGRRVELRVQSTLMSRLLGMKRGGAAQSPSMLFSSMRDFASVREFFTAATVGTVADLPFLVLFLALIASIGGPVVWVIVIGGILMILPSLVMRRRMAELTRQTQGAAIKSTRLLHEVVFDGDTIKSLRAEGRTARLWDEMTALSSHASSEQRKLSSILTFWAQGVQQATYVSAVVFGAFLVFAGEYTVGTIIAVGILTSRTLAPLTQLAGTLARWENVRGALDALDPLASAPQDREAGRSYLRKEELEGALELRGIRHAYAEDSGLALEVPGLRVEPGQRLALLGANGSGKSTLLKVLSGLHAPTEGTVAIDGIDMDQVMPRDLRRGIGYLGQEVRLFAGTLRENLNLSGLEHDATRIYQALDFAGLGPFVRRHPKGLDLDILDGGEGLSLGQRQSIGWARLWLQDPKVCLLDEPTASLDQTLEATLVARMRTWLQGRTAVIATHRLPMVDLCDRTIVLAEGRMAVDGPRAEVLDKLRQVQAARPVPGQARAAAPDARGAPA